MCLNLYLATPLKVKANIALRFHSICYICSHGHNNSYNGCRADSSLSADPNFEPVLNRARGKG